MDLPQEIESISFHTDTFTSIVPIPLRVAGVVNRGEMKKELKLLPESKQRENYICDHRAKMLTKSLGSLQLGNFFMLVNINVPVQSLSRSLCFSAKQPEELYHPQKGKHRGYKRPVLIYRWNKTVMLCSIPFCIYMQEVNDML